MGLVTFGAPGFAFDKGILQSRLHFQRTVMYERIASLAEKICTMRAFQSSLKIFWGHLRLSHLFGAILGPTTGLACWSCACAMPANTDSASTHEMV